MKGSRELLRCQRLTKTMSQLLNFVQDRGNFVILETKTEFLSNEIIRPSIRFETIARISLSLSLSLLISFNSHGHFTKDKSNEEKNLIDD